MFSEFERLLPREVKYGHKFFVRPPIKRWCLYPSPPLNLGVLVTCFDQYNVAKGLWACTGA